MLLHKFFYRCFFVISSCIISFIIAFLLFTPIYQSSSIIIPYSLHPYDICISYPLMWEKIKFYFILFYLLSSLFCFNSFYSLFLKKYFIKNKKEPKVSYNLLNQNNSLYLLVGKNENNDLVCIPEKSLYQNILITGTIGTGKTSSCMYPFTKQLIGYESQDQNKKIGMLILDVKGNYYKEVVNFAHICNRLMDLSIIEIGRFY